MGTAGTDAPLESRDFDPWEAPPEVPFSRAQLRELQRRSDGPALRFLAGHLGVALLTGGMVYLSLGNALILVIPAMFIHGSVLVFLFAPMHECSHGTAFRRRWLNSAVGSFCGSVLLRPARYFRWRHAAHHSYTQDPSRDPDLVPIPENLRQYVGELLGVRLWPKLVGTLYRSATGRFNENEREWIPEPERGRVANEARALIGLYTLVVAVSVAASWMGVLWFWLFPRMLAEPMLRVVRMVEHTGMDEGPDPMTNTRTTRPNPVVQFLYWNMPYHAEHHLAPSVPFHALPKMHEQIPHAPVPKSILRVHRELLKNLGKGGRSTAPRPSTGLD